VADVDRVGEVDNGWAVASTMIVFERGAGSSRTPRQGDQRRQLVPDLVALAQQAGRATEPEVRQLIARAQTDDYMQVQLGRHVAAAMSSNPGFAAYAKLAAGVFGPRRAVVAMAIGSGHAVTWKPGDPVAATPAMRYLGARASAIAAGSNEMQRNAIGERILGLPREPSFDRDKPFTEVLRDARNWEGKAPTTTSAARQAALKYTTTSVSRDLTSFGKGGVGSSGERQ
jgi:alkylation response protein AidB-like acyl-CoA dehydrogenase